MTNFDQIITNNNKFLAVIGVAKKIAPSDITVLITGENGTGKNLLATAIHNNSSRKNGPFVSLNCSAIPNSLLESEFFGHEKGAFTGAYATHKGKLEMAHKGTLFLDEIGNMHLETQAKILQALETKQFSRVGGQETLNVDVRILTATNQDLTSKVKNNQFRMDLYYRIREISLHIPPLRERKEDIPLLIDTFLNHFNKDFGKKITTISKTALNFLVNHEWKGNIRELRNVIRTSVALCEKNILWIEDIPIKMEFGNDPLSAGSNTPESFSMKDMEKSHILRTLQHCRWNKSKTAQLLEISRPRLDRKIQEFNLKKPDKAKKS
jgi:transcriptional regulator with PAS, ATPase and Fis domain